MTDSQNATDGQATNQKAVPLHGAAVAAILKLLNSQGLMTLATNSPEGQPHVSTLGYANDGLNIYFVTARDSEKRRNLLADSRAGAAIRGRAEEGEAIGVSVEGRALPVENHEEIEALNRQVQIRSPDQAPFAPGNDDAVVFKLVPHAIKAVAVVEGRSRAQTFTIGDVEAATQGVAYVPSAIARLF
jgi:general stress protein 26